MHLSLARLCLCNEFLLSASVREGGMSDAQSNRQHLALPCRTHTDQSPVGPHEQLTLLGRTGAQVAGHPALLHVAVGALDQWSVEDVHAYLGTAERHEIKFLCVNDLPEVERNFPDARAWIEEAIGG